MYKRRRAYNIVASALCAIQRHYTLAQEGEFGFSMDIESLLMFMSIDPDDWFLNYDDWLGYNVSTNDLDENDQYDLVMALDALAFSETETQFKEACRACKQLLPSMEGKFLETFLISAW